jgi:hypothetical protein
MVRLRLLSILVLILGSRSSFADEEAPRLKFTKGETLTYRVEQTTLIEETIVNSKTNKPETTKLLTKLSLVKNWKVSEVDIKGIATLELSLGSMKLERQLPNGETDTFDSNQPDKENQQEMKRLIGTTLAELKLDSRGQLITVVKSQYGTPESFTSELPLKTVMPPKNVTEGESWNRKYTIKLDPPAGTGETYDTTQTYTMKAPINGFIVIGITTTVKEEPTQATDLMPLLPMMMQGDVYIHVPTGRYYGARLKTQKTIENHQGEGSRYTFINTITEDFVPRK